MWNKISDILNLELNLYRNFFYVHVDKLAYDQMARLLGLDEKVIQVSFSSSILVFLTWSSTFFCILFSSLKGIKETLITSSVSAYFLKPLFYFKQLVFFISFILDNFINSLAFIFFMDN